MTNFLTRCAIVSIVFLCLVILNFSSSLSALYLAEIRCTTRKDLSLDVVRSCFSFHYSKTRLPCDRFLRCRCSFEQMNLRRMNLSIWTPTPCESSVMLQVPLMTFVPLRRYMSGQAQTVFTTAEEIWKAKPQKWCYFPCCLLWVRCVARLRPFSLWAASLL